MSSGRGFETRLRGKQFYERHWSTTTSKKSTTRSGTTAASSSTRRAGLSGSSGSARKSGLRHVPSSTDVDPCPPPPPKTPKSPVQGWNSPKITSASQFASGPESAPSSPMLTGTPVFQSAPSSPMLQSSEWSSTPTTSTPTPAPTATETEGAAFGGGPPPNAEDAAGPPPQASHPSDDSTTLLIAGTSALGSLLLICALLWALIVRAKRGQRRKHLAEVLEKVGTSTSPSSSTSDMSRKDSFGNVGLFGPTEWEDLAEKAIGLPSATSDVTLQKDASFCWKYPTLSVPPAAARAMTETHYVKRRSTIPARPRSEVRKDVRIGPVHTVDPPLRDPLAEPVDYGEAIMGRRVPETDLESLVTESDAADADNEHDEEDHDEDDDDGPPAWLIALAGMDSNLASTFPELTDSASAPSTSAASDSDARKGWLNLVIPPVRRTSASTAALNSHVSLAPTLRSLASVYSTPASPQLPPMIVPSITITVDDGDFGIVDRPLSLIEERGYDSESAEGCLDPDEFPTIPRWESQLRRF